MQIRRSAERVEILAPAKVNLFFEVLAPRDDGFHEIESLMVPVGLFDTLTLEDDRSGRVTLDVRGAAGIKKQSRCDAAAVPRVSDEIETLPEGDDNIAVKALRLLARQAGIERGARLRLVKRIPMAAGLGGGSSDAAAALVAANMAWKLDWPVGRLAAVAAELGSDVPFFLAGGPAVCRGRGEKVQPVGGLGGLHLVVVRPPEGLSTAAVYRACQASRPRPIDPVMEALRRKDLKAIGPVTHNRLLDPARRMSPWVGRVLDRLAAERCVAIGMSGSGTSCFAVCRTAREAACTAARVRARLGGTCRVWAVRSL